VNFDLISSILVPQTTPLSILAEGYFGTRQAKTAYGVMRYGNYPIHSVIDSTKAGQSVAELAQVQSTLLVSASLEEACIETKPKALLLGIAPIGGDLPDSWLAILKEAITNGIHIINGLHYFLNDNKELKDLAIKHDVILWDVRDPYIYSASSSQSVAKQSPRPDRTKVITTVGSDCNVGKMCCALELHQEFLRQGYKSSFLATGQTGIIISNFGIPLDRIIGDFMAGSVENAINEIIAKDNPQFIFVEGQGSLLHPGYSGVTLSLIHGSNPDAMLLCHKPDSAIIQGDYEVIIPSMIDLVNIYETAVAWTNTQNLKRAKVLGISLNTSTYDEPVARMQVKQLELETELAVTDVIRFGVSNIVKEIIKL
jgi:uncharacterized NAD-dependent epimerase/dehydratase family protein